MSRRRTVPAFGVAIVLAAVLAAPVAAGQVRLRVTASPSPMNFGSVAVGQESAAQLIYVTNRSAIPIRWTGTLYQYGPNAFGSWDITLSGGIGLTASCFDLPGVTIEPGQTCALDMVRFKPQATGALSVTFLVRFTDGLNVLDISVTAKGRGV
jgi:hypothetical protein